MIHYVQAHAATLLLLARIIAGEAGTCPQATQVEVASSIATWYYDDVPVSRIAAAWHGRDDPDPFQLNLACMILSRKLERNGLYFVLSDDDIRSLHVTKKADFVARCYSNTSLHFFKRWPKIE